MKSPQGDRWRRLDNTAKIFPVIANENLSNVYRISATLKDEVVPGTLQRALEEVLPQFESFCVKLRRGFFWYYFETNKRMPVVERETTYPCKYIDPHSNELYLFRVSYYERRINLEVFHAITDGLGAVNFLKALVYRYLDIIKDDRSGLEVTSRINPDITMNVEDSYIRNYEKVKRRKYSSRTAYHLTGKKLLLDEEMVTHIYADTEQLKKAGKSYGVSITKFLAASLIWCIYRECLHGKPDHRPIGISIPINLRSFFGSETMANFFAVTLILFQPEREDHSFEEILEAVSLQMDEKITRDKLSETISYNVSNEKKWYIRIAPLWMKWCVLNTIFRRNDKAYTMTLSNIGPVGLEAEYSPEVEQFHLMIGVSKRQPVKCAVCSYGDSMVITFTSVYEDRELMDGFSHFLNEQHIKSEQESNGLPDERDDRGMYPHIHYDPKKWKSLVNCFYGILFTMAVILGLINYVTYADSLWSVVAIGCIAYVGLTVRYSVMRHANLAGKLLVQIMAAQVLLVLTDYATGYGGWAVNYAIPSTVLFADLAVIFLIIVNRLHWQSYFMYQLVVTMFSVILLLLWALGLITRPVMAIVTVVVTIGLLAATVLLGDRSVKTELKRRFHL